MIRVIPSLFTLGNLLCGFAAIFCASRFPARDLRLTADQVEFVPTLVIAASLVFIGMVFDALDGRIARLTRQTSELGEQLDSMADMVTFGAAPAFLVIQLVEIGLPIFGETHPRWDTAFERFVFIVAAVYLACTALRLARFNIELEAPGESDHMSFKGLPSPAAAGTVCSLVLMQQWLIGDVDHASAEIWAEATSVGMVFITLLSAVAMVSLMRYPHVGNRFLRDKAPTQYLGAGIFILIPLSTYPQLTLAIGFTAFALSAPILMLLRRVRGRDVRTAGQKAAPKPHTETTPPLRIKHN